MSGVAVVGSLNVDVTIRVQRLPAPGETVLGGPVTVALGGKGLNQAVTAARQGAAVAMVACVGADPEGDRLRETLRAERIDVAHVHRDPTAGTGRAHITVDDTGTNTIVVAANANASLSVGIVERARPVIERAAVVLAQLECPLDAVVRALQLARAAGAVTILNPAPARPLGRDVLSLVDVLVPNETEAGTIGAAPGVGTVVVTLGERGALVRDRAGERLLPALAVRAVDPTAAGDAFCGALAAALAARRPLDDALRRAAAAGAHAVTVPGAFPSLPTVDDVERLLAAGGREPA